MRMLIHLSVLFNLIHNILTKAGPLALVTMEYAIRTMLQRLLQWCYIITGETKLACHQRSRALAVSFHTLLVTSCCRHPGHQDRESTNVTAETCRCLQLHADGDHSKPRIIISHLSVSPIDIPSLHEVLLLDVSKLMLLCPVFKVYNSRKPFIVLVLVLSNICFARENPRAYIGSWWAQRSDVCRHRVMLLPATDQCR